LAILVNKIAIFVTNFMFWYFSGRLIETYMYLHRPFPWKIYLCK